MNRILTILLGVLAVGAIVFLAIYEPLTKSTRERDWAVRDGRVLDLDPGRVKVIRIVTGDNELEIKRRGNGWQLGAKSKDRADNALVGQLLSVAADLKFFDRIDDREPGYDWGDYGLKKPKRRIEFESDGRKKTLYLGKDAANENRLYARADGSRDVFLIDDRIQSLAFTDASRFRDRRLTDLEPGQIDRLIVRRQGGEIELRHDATGWEIIKPLHARADEKKVTEYLRLLLGLRILEFVAEDSGDLGSHGLMEGRDEITFYADGGNRHQTLRLGAEREGVVVGHFTARDSIYQLPAAALGLLKITPDVLRDRRLLPVNLDIVDVIKVRAGEKEFLIRRAGEGWSLQADGETKAVSEGAIRRLVDVLADAKVENYTPAVGVDLASFGLKPPDRTVEFYSSSAENTAEAPAGEQLVARISFGKPGKGLLPVRVGDAPEIATVKEDVLLAAPRDPADWISPQ